MARRKSYSSKLTALIDMTGQLGKGLLEFREELTQLTADSERLKELEPLLKDIKRAAAVATPDQPPPPPTEPPVMDGQHLEKTASDDFQQIEEPPPGPEQIKKRVRRAKKIIDTGEVPPPEG